MNKIDLNALRDRAYKIACEHGFHNEVLSNEHCFCLVISELMEAVEADRKSRHFDKEKYKIGEYSECQGWLTNEEKIPSRMNLPMQLFVYLTLHVCEIFLLKLQLKI